MRSRWDLGPESRQTEGYTIGVMSIIRLTRHHARCQTTTSIEQVLPKKSQHNNTIYVVVLRCKRQPNGPGLAFETFNHTRLLVFELPSIDTPVVAAGAGHSLHHRDRQQRPEARTSPHCTSLVRSGRGRRRKIAPTIDDRRTGPSECLAGRGPDLRTIPARAKDHLVHAAEPRGLDGSPRELA
jgi:hypothetical protein